VERTKKLEQYHNSRLLPVPEALFSGEISGYFSGIIREAEHNIYLLNIEEILSLGHDDPIRFSNPNAPMFKGRRILVAEDAPFFRKRCAQILESQGAILDIAVNGQDGLELFKKNGQQYDLVFTDIEMPMMSGIEMAVAIKKIDPSKHIIFNSAISNPNLIEEIRSKQLGEYILKFDEKTILEKIAQALKTKVKN
jgi:CheY-like chemotaxis protein